MSSYRLPAPAGERLDRSSSIAFRFNGEAFTGFAGDTLASALLANGVQLVGRSFKLHRPRGIISCGVEEPTGLVDIGSGGRRTPNVRATLLELHPGLEARSVNCWPSVGFDLGALNGFFSALLPAGFYYKTFKWPSWHLFEPSIRRMAGLGRGTRELDPDRYDETSIEADVAVVGGGIAGLAAASAAARAGARTILMTSGAHFGGALRSGSDARIAELLAAAANAGVRMLPRALGFGVYDHNLLCARENLEDRSGNPESGRLRERLWKIRARAIVAATGAIERPMLFPDNDRPGVMLAGAAQKYAARFGVACGRRVVIAANSDSAYQMAEFLAAAGIDVAAIVDRREPADPGARGAAPKGVRVFESASIVRVAGVRAVAGCTVQSGERRAPVALECDAVLSAGGHAPAVHLHSQAGGKLRWVEECAMFVPDGAARGLFSVGACAGVFDVESARLHGAAVGEALARGAPAPPAPVGGAGRSLALTQAPDGARHRLRAGKRFVDLQNDVTLDDVALAARENYRSIEHLKRYTTTGMGTDQGKTSNVNALVSMGDLTGRAPGEVGTTKFRPPFAPVTLGALVGRRRGELLPSLEATARRAVAPRARCAVRAIRLLVPARGLSSGGRRPRVRGAA